MRRFQGMPREGQIPRNELLQPPTRTPQETALRLRDKQRVQHGQANRRRTEKRIREVERRG